MDHRHFMAIREELIGSGLIVDVGKILIISGVTVYNLLMSRHFIDF